MKQQIFNYIAVALIALSATLSSCAKENEVKKGGLFTDKGVVINGIRWATRNVDKPSTFTNNPEDAGMFYQWNRKTGWTDTDQMAISSDGTMWDSSTPIGYIWEKANDPCPEGWYVPTLYEIRLLLDADKVSSELITVNNITGRKFTDKTTGNSLFLPAVGYCAVGTFGGANILGIYWTVTQSDDSNAYMLYFNSNRADKTVFGCRYACPIRCVEDIVKSHK